MAAALFAPARAYTRHTNAHAKPRSKAPLYPYRRPLSSSAVHPNSRPRFVPLSSLSPSATPSEGPEAPTAFTLVHPDPPRPDRLWSAVMLVAGCTVGAGIIALPVKTAAAGFLPSSVALACSWGYMCVAAMLLVELSMYYGGKANLVTMAGNTLGRAGKVLCSSLYIFIYSATLTAYIAEGALRTDLGIDTY